MTTINPITQTQGVEAPSQKGHRPDALVVTYLILMETSQIMARSESIEGKAANAVEAEEKRDINKARALDGFKPIYAWWQTIVPSYTSYSKWDILSNPYHHHAAERVQRDVKTAREDQGIVKQIDSERDALNAHFGVSNQQAQIEDTKLEAGANNSAMTTREAGDLLTQYVDLMYKVLMRRKPN